MSHIKMSRKNFVAVLLVGLSLVGCSQKHRVDAFDPPRQHISPSATADVMLAGDGTLGARRYEGSGRALSLATVTALSPRLAHVSMADSVKSVDAAIRSARAAGTTYVVQPIIMHWEDRATEWSGRPDRVTVQIIVWDPKSEAKVASTTASASSKWGTFGGDHPEDLLPQMLAQFTSQLFAGSR